jgi:hypothetical protein
VHRIEWDKGAKSTCWNPLSWTSLPDDPARIGASLKEVLLHAAAADVKLRTGVDWRAGSTTQLLGTGVGAVTLTVCVHINEIDVALPDLEIFELRIG